MSREGQERVEVRPGVWLWLNEADRKALAPKPEKPQPEAIESTSTGAPETATQPRAAVRRPKGR